MKARPAVVGMGRGIAAGARQVMLAILEELKKRNVSDVIVTEAGCIGLLPMNPGRCNKTGSPKVTYVNMNPDKARR